MSVKALDAVFDHSRATGSTFTVALALADWCDQAFRCYPSYNQIATKARCSRATAIAAIQELVTLGEWSVEKHGAAPSTDDADGPTNVRAQWRNTYRCLLVRRREVVQPVDHPSSAIESAGSPAAEPPVAREVVQPADHLSDAEGVQSASAGGPIQTPQVVQSGDAHIRNKPSVRPSDQPSVCTPPKGHRAHAFCGERFCVPQFLHDEFEKQLGDRGLARFDPFDWYARLDARYADIPIGGDVLAFVRGEFRAATKDLFADPRRVLQNRALGGRR